MPITKTVPTAMKAQGFASYSVCGVQERIGLVYSHGRPAMRFVTMTQYAFFGNISSGWVLPAGGLGNSG